MQEVRDLDDPQQKGVGLTAELVTWLSTARASISVDQYIYHDCDDGTPN